MSDICDFLATVEFRDFIASFAKELAAEEVYQVAYVWLQKRGDVDLFSPSCKPKACGLELFAKLECSGVFSRKDPSGLRDIAKRINRSDLVEKVDAFTKDASKMKRRTSEKKCLQKKSSEERQELERTFESIVVQMAVLEQHISLLQRTLCQQKTDSELMDEGLEIIEHSSEIAQNLALKLSQVQKRLANRSRTNSSASGSSDGSNGRPSSGGEVSQVESAPSPTDVVAAPPKMSLCSHPLPPPQVLPRRNRENTAVTSVPSSRSPIPKLSVPEVRLEEDEGTGDSGMESGSGSAYSTPHLWRHPIQTTLREKKKATRIYMSLKDETRDEGPALSRSKYVPSTLTIGTKPQTEAATEEDDCTGDSGMGTGSDSAVEDSKSHRKAATDVEDATEKENFYTALREGTKERAHSYQVLKRGSALREGTKERGNLVNTPKLLDYQQLLPTTNYQQFDTTSATEGERTFDGCLLPESMTLSSTLSDCTSEGRKFTDEANDFSLEIPEGAIPEGERHTVDVGVGLFGTFQFPEGLRPVSPVFWVCVRDQKNFQFSKHVPVTLPHFLNLENDDDIQSLGLTFLKADHNMNSEGLYEFNPTDGEMDFQTFKSHGILRTLHFCSLCIATKDIPKSLEKALFCITAVLPKFSIPVGKSIDLYFLITFLNLKTCLKKVSDIIATMELDGHKTKQVKFQFNTNTRTPALEMIITQPKHGKIGLSGNTKVFRSDVDFFVKRRLSEGELNTLKSDKFYPPRFEGYFASFRENATLDDCKIVFKGATSDIVYDIHLDCPTAIPAIKVDMSTQTQSKLLLDINRDLHKAKRDLQHLSKQELKELFLELGLFDATVRDNFTDSSRDSYAEDLIRAWILGRDGIMTKEEYKGGATWENLKKALRNINHPGVAAVI